VLSVGSAAEPPLSPNPRPSMLLTPPL